MSSVSSHLRQNILLILTIVAVSTGIGLGLFARSFNIQPGSVLLRAINFPGEIFLRGIKLLIIPLISSSLIVGIAGNSVAKTGAIARRTLFFFFVTTLEAVVLGVFLVLIVQPGKLNRQLINSVDSNTTTQGVSSDPSVPKLSTLDTFMDVVRNLVPDNLIEMCFQIYRSKIEVIKGIHYNLFFLLSNSFL